MQVNGISDLKAEIREYSENGVLYLFFYDYLSNYSEDDLLIDWNEYDEEDKLYIGENYYYQIRAGDLETNIILIRLPKFNLSNN